MAKGNLVNPERTSDACRFTFFKTRGRDLYQWPNAQSTHPLPPTNEADMTLAYFPDLALEMVQFIVGSLL